MDVFGSQWHDVLGALHGLLVLVTLFAFVMGAIFLFAVSSHNWKHIQITTLIGTLLYIFSFFIGISLLPNYDVNVRSAFLEVRAPNSVGLFEIKEHLSTIGFFVALALLVLVLFGHMRKATSARKQLFAALFCTLALLTLVASILAYVLAARRG